MVIVIVAVALAAALGGDTVPSRLVAGGVAAVVGGSVLIFSLTRRGAAAETDAEPQHAPPSSAALAAIVPGRIEALIDAQDDPAFLADREGRVERCNAAAARVFGASPAAVVGRPVRGLFTRKELVEAHEAATRGRKGRLRVGLPTAMGERVFDVVMTPLEPGAGASPTATVLRDVTELAETLRIKTDFVANASHEFRTPLAAIRAGVETLADGAKSDPAMLDRVLSMIGQHVVRLEDLTRDLLDLSRLEQPGLALRLEPLILSKLQDGLLGEFGPVMGQRGVRIEFAIDPSFEGCETDPRLLFVVLRNLIDNATKFCHEGTAVQVRGRWASRDPDDDRAGRWLFEVQDEGIGIPLSQQARVFERFYQVDPGRSGFGSQRRGTGLGLAIARHALRAMGGRIGLESLWQKGTTVWFEIPTPPEPPRVAEAAEPSP